MFLARSWSTSSPEPWTPCGQVPSATCSAPTTSSSVRVVLETTGLKDVSCALLILIATLWPPWLRGEVAYALRRRVSSLRFFSFFAQCVLTSPSFLDYTEGAELVDSVLDVVRKEAEGTDCLQGKLKFLAVTVT